MQAPTDTYNGWTNYQTWRVHLEFFDGSTYEDITGESIEANDEALRELKHALASRLRDDVEEAMNTQGSGSCLDYAMAFLGDVDWHEIADHIIDYSIS